MGRKIFAVLIGLIVGNIAIMLLHKVGGIFYPFPEGMDQNNMDDIATYMETAPLGAFIAVLIAHAGGPFFGSMGMSWVAGDKKSIKLAYVIGGLFTAFGVANLIMLPHPMWFNIDALIYLPMAYLGYRLLNKD
jgi:hypothetical protein